MLSPEMLKDFIKLNTKEILKEILKEELEIDIQRDTTFGTLEVVISYAGEEVTRTSIWGSDIESLLGK